MAEQTLTQRMQNLVEETTQTMLRTPTRLLNASRGAFSMTREEAEQLVSRGENLYEKLVERGEGIGGKQTQRLGGWARSWERRGRKQLHATEEQIEQRVREVLDVLHIPSADDVNRLDQELNRLTRKLDAHIKTTLVASLPIQGYADMNVKEILPLLEGLDEAGLVAISEFEQAGSGRKTILREIERLLEGMEPVA